jgi:CBS domain-containing protein
MSLIRLGNKPPLTIGPQDTAEAAARAMTERNVGAAAVILDDKLLGIVTERDVMRKIVAADRDPRTTRVRDIMSSPAISIGLNTSVATAASVMRENHIRHLVILNNDQKVAGILALRYVLYDMLDDMERNVGDLIGYIMIDGPGG